MVPCGGVFACHNMTPKIPDPSALGASELAGKLMSLRVQHALEVERQKNLQACTKVSNRVIVLDDSELAVTDYWVATRQEVADLLPCDGVIFVMDGVINTYGNLPSKSACYAILQLGLDGSTEVSAFDDLQSALPGENLGDTAGALVIAPLGSSGIRIVFLRNVATKSIPWAGSPDKDLTHDTRGP